MFSVLSNRYKWITFPDISSRICRLFFYEISLIVNCSISSILSTSSWNKSLVHRSNPQQFSSYLVPGRQSEPGCVMLVVSVRKWHILCCPNSFKKLVIIGRASFISVHTDREARPPEHHHNRFILTHKLQYPCLASIKHPSLVVKCISMAVACKLIVLVSP